jgi:hypothetical protein
MLIETTVTLVVAGFVTITLYGHLLVAQAVLVRRQARRD